MWRNYLTVGFRALIKARAYAFINIFGLALGLAACLMILLYVRYETSYDEWLPDHERIHQVQATWSEPGQPVRRSQNSPFPVRETLPSGFPQIEALTVLRSGPAPLMRDGKPIFIDAAIVDASFFEIFQLAFVDGSAATALPDTNSIVLAESEAVRQFGRADVVGRTVTLGAGPGKRDYGVSGVVRDPPKNSSLRFDVIFRHNPADFDGLPADFTGWGNMNQQHYVKLRRGADAGAINAALPAWEKRAVAPQMIGGEASSQADIMDLKLVPIADVHLGEAQDGALAPGGDRRTLATFGIVALLTLAMAIINFVNLSTARASRRAGEIALRKTLGARRSQLVVQFMGESLIVTAVAMLLALTAVELAAPWISAWIGADLRMAYLGEGGMLLPALGLFAATGLLAGLYPAVHLSRVQPAKVLRANNSLAETAGAGRLRAGLVVLQFAIAIGLIVCTAIIYSQTRYIATFDPGYRRDGLIELDSAWHFASDPQYRPARAELLAVPGVVSVARTHLGIAADNETILAVRAPGAPEDLSIGTYGVDADFFHTMEIPLLAGRALGDRFAHDRIVRDPETGEANPAGRALNIVVNRNAARLLGFASPDEAVGEAIRVGIGGDLAPATIVGVVGDTRVRTARDAIEPILYTYDPDGAAHVLVRYAGARPSDVMADLEKVWLRFEPEIPFRAEFAETIVAEVHAAVRARGVLFAIFSTLAIVIACLGLFGLAAFTAERRTKEIGIRKVFGARVRDIVRLLAWQFSKPVVLANLIAWPVAWWAMRDWLNTFDARIDLGPGPFAFAGLLALGIAVGTVAGHAFKVARANPIHALRYE